jgi:hypothetical protein
MESHRQLGYLCSFSDIKKDENPSDKLSPADTSLLWGKECAFKTATEVMC